MVPGRSQDSGRTIPLGWSEAERSSAARSPTRTPSRGEGPRPRRDATRPGRGVSAPALLLLATLLILPVLVDRVERPEDVVRDYLEALVAADAEALGPFLAAPEGALDLALTPEIAHAADDRVLAYSLERVEVRGLEAVVTASLRSGRELRTVDFVLHGRSIGHFGTVRWRLTPVRLPQLDLALPVGASRLLVNGVEMQIPEVTWRPGLLTPRLLTLRVLPGTYRIALPTQGRPVVAHPVEIRAPLREVAWWSGRVEVGVDLDPAEVSTATALLHDELETCTRSTSSQPVGCPFSVDLPNTVRGDWEIRTSPRLRYFRTSGGAFDFSGRGLVAAFTERSGAGADPGRVHVVRRDIAASVEHVAGGYQLAAWHFTNVAPR